MAWKLAKLSPYKEESNLGVPLLTPFGGHIHIQIASFLLAVSTQWAKISLKCVNCIEYSWFE